MITMQDKLTAEVDALAGGLGLNAAITYAAAANIGNWWIAEGTAPRLRVGWRFSTDHATWTLTGPAADRAHDDGMTWPGPARPVEHHLGSGRYEFGITLNYGTPGSVADGLAKLAAVLAPWRTDASIDDALSRLRAALIESHPKAAAALGQARARLAGNGGGRGAAAHFLDEALGHLPEDTERGRQIAELADLLSASPVSAATR
jgi:hypothetical protein